MRLFYLNEKTGKEIDIEGTLDEYYQLIGCNTIDIVTRQVGDKVFDVICDDDGLLKENPRVSAIDITGMPMLVGNLIFSHTDDEGETIGLSDEDIDYLSSNIRFAYQQIGDKDVMIPVVIMDYY